MKNILKPLLWIMILIGGFFLGTSWQNSQQVPTKNISPDEKILVSNQHPSNAKMVDKEDRFTEFETATINLFERAAPTVVFITTSNVRRDYWSRNVSEIPRGTGSGFVWDKEGHIITNYHVIQGADRATVTFSDQTTYQASLVGAAPEKDLAVLRIEAENMKLKPIPVGASDNLRVGQSVFAIGNPFGLDQTLTTGIISALGREIESVGKVPIRDVIQTDAAINPGNSGGPLLDSQGKLIGVNTAIFSPSGAYAGVGFSIPSHVVAWVVPDLIKYGKINRPTLGVELASPQVMRRMGMEGILILEVLKGGAAEKSGLRPTRRTREGSIVLGDVITAINGDKVGDRGDLILILEKYKPGDKVTLSITRDYKPVKVELTFDMMFGQDRVIEK